VLCNHDNAFLTDSCFDLCLLLGHLDEVEVRWTEELLLRARHSSVTASCQLLYHDIFLTACDRHLLLSGYIQRRCATNFSSELFRNSEA